MTTQNHSWGGSTRRHSLPLPWCPCSFQGINTHAQTDCLVTSLTRSATRLPPGAGFSFVVSSFYESPSFLGFFVPYENNMQISSNLCQFYLNSSAGFILLVCFSLLENGLIIPLIHETDLISSPRMSLQTRPVSCRAQTSGAFSGRFRVELPSSPHSCCVLEPSPCSELGLAHAEPLQCEGGVWWHVCKLIPGSCYRQKTSPLRKEEMKGWHS